MQSANQASPYGHMYPCRILLPMPAMITRVLSERQTKNRSQFGTQKKRYYPILFWCFSSFLSYRVSFFLPPPPNLTMSQAHHKFLYLENFRGGQFKLYRAWDLVKLGGGGQKKSHPVSLSLWVWPLRKVWGGKG